MSEKWSVLILMGSDSDWEVMQEAAKMLKEFEVGYEMTVSSLTDTTVAAALKVF